MSSLTPDEFLVDRINNTISKLQGSISDIDALTLTHSLNYSFQERKKILHQSMKYLDDCVELIGVRDTAIRQLVNMRSRVKQNYSFLNNSVDFITSRLLHFTQYINIKWSIYDLITKISGKLLSSHKSIYSPTYNPKLTNFVFHKGNFSLPFSNLLKENFGFPIILSYLIRNLFVHDGGKIEKNSFFKITNSSDQLLNNQPYFLSIPGKQYLLNNIHSEGLDSSNSRVPLGIYLDQNDVDLLDLLESCRKEMDYAISLILISASEFSVNQTKLLLESFTQ